jgi:hypothetical protein
MEVAKGRNVIVFNIKTEQLYSLKPAQANSLIVGDDNDDKSWKVMYACPSIRMFHHRNR